MPQCTAHVVERLLRSGLGARQGNSAVRVLVGIIIYVLCLARSLWWPLYDAGALDFYDVDPQVYKRR